jgi:hypothetical protein
MKYLRVMLVVLLAIIGIGYYHFNVNASGDLKKGIYYDNIDYTDNVEFNNVDGLALDYSANLVKPGDYYELYFDVVNSTGYNVEITDCIYNDDDEYIDYDLVYENGDKINIGDIIKKGESVRVKYKVLYKEYIDQLDYTFDTSFSILYEQTI